MSQEILSIEAGAELGLITRKITEDRSRMRNLLAPLGGEAYGNKVQ